MILNCIAVDDEPIALDMITQYIAMTPSLQLAAKCNSAVEAMKVLHSQPDIQLIFLDIRMADLSGMDMAKIIAQSEQRRNTRVIFTTAFDKYALESYKVAALDYLVKPFSYTDFSRAVTKALEYFGMGVAAPVVVSEKQHIYFKVEYQLVKVLLDDILYIEGLKDYVKVYLDNEDKQLMTLTSLKALEDKLPPTRFLRLHRSYIINLDKVRATTKTSVQIHQLTIPITEQYKVVFQDFLSKWV
ncbi:LytTR family DNA-binding domain-containing protein [Chitinophaga sancti]|uniref:LytR/AlgR family response regulator transcription factor n=1 Tax=Chitinophaga sancti TaxID=1004 RepID=UPI002A756D41|nr:LytTR family DNA-binding domain-containing protein [Chitinophaga sancti]WPQ60524.1 LytTR family DNA-binding domain-containing protein [Chitinophaga sancti]